MNEEIKNKTKEKMEQAVEALKKDYAVIRTGRASVALLDNVLVDAYGSSQKLNQTATLTTPDPRTIMIQPWDPKLIGDIEKAIMKADLGLMPVNDGKVVRINVPQLTEERRKEFVKVAKKRSEEGKVAVRNIRRDTNDRLKKLEKDKEMSEDELKKDLDEIQKMTDSYTKKIDGILEHKESEIMEV
jgi:ribosome recycling factor